MQKSGSFLKNDTSKKKAHVRDSSVTSQGSTNEITNGLRNHNNYQKLRTTAPKHGEEQTHHDELVSNYNAF